MRIFVADSGGVDGDAVLSAALQMARPGDTVIIAAAVNVPSHLPLDAPAGVVWKQVCRAESVLHWARRFADWHVPDGVRLRYTRIQGRSYAHVALAGAANYGADLMLIGKPRGMRGALSTWFGTIRGVLDGAPCAVRVIAPDATPVMEAPPARRPGLDPLENLAIIAVNPAVTQRFTSNKPEGQPAS
jgi:hypothetical protein